MRAHLPYLPHVLAIGMTGAYLIEVYTAQRVVGQRNKLLHNLSVEHAKLLDTREELKMWRDSDAWRAKMMDQMTADMVKAAH